MKIIVFFSINLDHRKLRSGPQFCSLLICRTIVEHLVMILEKHEFLCNSLNTGWLDVLIAKKEQAAKPNKNVSLICGALNVADQVINSNFQSFK